MSEIDPRAEMPLVDWSELGVSDLLPTGTVTLLLADVEGSTQLWETQPDEMTAAFARLNSVVSDVIAAYDGVPRSSRARVTASFPANSADTDGEPVPVTVARTLRLLDHPGRSTTRAESDTDLDSTRGGSPRRRYA